MTVDTAAAPPRQFDEDLILIDRFLEGERGAFDAIYGKYYDRVYAIAKGILLDSEDAADATQEAFTLMHRNLRRFHRRSRLSTWIFRIAVNTAIQETRRHKNRKKTEAIDQAAEVPAPTIDVPAPDPHVEAAMRNLKPADRAILTLFYWDDATVAEISETLGCSLNATKTRLFRAREHFKAAYSLGETGNE
jgi:RNA polymerase sigma-70 factor (ECF subfamily)